MGCGRMVVGVGLQRCRPSCLTLWTVISDDDYIQQRWLVVVVLWFSKCLPLFDVNQWPVWWVLFSCSTCVRVNRSGQPFGSSHRGCRMLSLPVCLLLLRFGSLALYWPVGTVVGRLLVGGVLQPLCALAALSTCRRHAFAPPSIR